MEPARPLTAELYRSQASLGKFGRPQPMESDRPGAILAYTARPMDLLALWPWLLVLVACSLLAGVVAGLLGGFSGLAVEALQKETGSEMSGYASWFSVTPFAAIPPLLLIWLISRLKKAVRA